MLRISVDWSSSQDYEPQVRAGFSGYEPAYTVQIFVHVRPAIRRWWIFYGTAMLGTCFPTGF